MEKKMINEFHFCISKHELIYKKNTEKNKPAKKEKVIQRSNMRERIHLSV